MNEQKIYYRKVRNFGQIFGDSFGYIRQNFKSLFGSIILFTLPIITLITLLAVYLVNAGISQAGNFGRGSNNFIGSMFFVIFIIFVLFLLAQAVYITVINEHLIINEQLPNEEFVKTNNVNQNFFKSFWRVLGNCMLLGIIAILFLFAYALINSVISSIFATGGVVGILLGALIQLLISLTLTPIVGYLFISTMLVVQKEKVGVVTALKKVFFYLKGNFWLTWCISFIGYIITYIATIIVMIPAIIFMVLQVFSRVKYNSGSSSEISTTTIIIGACIFLLTMMLALCVYCVYFLMCNFQYTNLEEKKEGNFIIEKINQIQ